ETNFNGTGRTRIRRSYGVAIDPNPVVNVTEAILFNKETETAKPPTQRHKYAFRPTLRDFHVSSDRVRAIAKVQHVASRNRCHSRIVSCDRSRAIQSRLLD